MSKLPASIRRQLQKEANEWDALISRQSPEEVGEQIEMAEPFVVPRPPRQPVSVRLDPSDISMLKRLARRKGIPYTQLMAMWLHERLVRERDKQSA
jgi:predicted DNA binding CopG/RHH family protein